VAFVIVAAAFFCGAYAAVSQSYLAREFLVVFLGNEMSLAVLLAGWLVGVAAGARAARLGLFDRYPAAYLAAACLAAWVVLLPVTLVTVRISRVVLGISPGAWASLSDIAAAAFLFVGVFAAFAGFAFVTLCRLSESARSFTNPVGTVYVSEAAGCVAGGLLFTFLLAGRVPAITAAFAGYACMGAVSLALAIGAAKARLLSRGTALTVVIGTGMLACCGIFLVAGGRDRVVEANSALRRMQTISPGRVVDARETRYQNLTTIELGGQYTVFGNGEALMTFPDENLEEIEAFTILTEHEDPKRVLVIGGGPAFLAPILDYGVESIDYVELDPAVITVAREHLKGPCAAGLDSPRVTMRFGDARSFLESRGAGAPFDVIVVRMPDPRTLLLNRFQTREFMELAKGNLAPRGIFVLPVTLADGYVAGDVGRYAGDVHRTMSAVFGEVLAAPETNSLFFACVSRGVLTSSCAELAQRLAARKVRSGIFPAYFAAVFPEEETASLNAALSALPAGEVNADWRPTTYAASLVLWARYSRSTVARWVLASTRVKSALLFCALVLAALLGVLPVLARRSVSAAASIGILYTGFSAMSMSVLVLYAFQVKCGYVYDWIGALTASFIGGLCLGGVLGSARAATRRRLIGAEVFACLAPLAGLAALGIAAGRLSADHARYVILFVSVGAGLATGFEFPVAAGILSAAGSGARDAASRLQALDQAGACAGALVTGILIVPALGIWLSLGVLAAVKACSALCAIACTGGQGVRSGPG